MSEQARSGCAVSTIETLELFGHDVLATANARWERTLPSRR